MEIAWDDPGVVSPGMRLSAIAPIDDGTDSGAIGDRLLRAAPSLLDHCQAVQTFDLTWVQPVVLRHRRLFGRDDRLAFQGHVGEHRSALVLAASYCARNCCGGFGLWRDDGLVWICWTLYGKAFDAWLRSTIPEFSCAVERH